MTGPPRGLALVPHRVVCFMPDSCFKKKKNNKKKTTKKSGTMSSSSSPPPPPPWSDLTWEVWVHIWGYLESTTLWTCRQVCWGWNCTIVGTSRLANFDATCLDMSHWPDYVDTIERARVSPEARHMFASVQHLKLCCGSLTHPATHELPFSVWMGQFMTL